MKLRTAPQRRLLVLAPFAPRFDAAHGGARALAQLLGELTSRHRVGLLYLRADDEPPIDSALAAACTLVEEVRRPPVAAAQVSARSHRPGPPIRALLGGMPLWATGWAVPAYRQRLDHLVRTWPPDIVQIEYHLMGQYLPALDACPAPRVLTQYEPGTAAARAVLRTRQRQGRVLPYLDLLAWARFERAIARQVQAIVVFTERDRRAMARLAGSTPLARIPLGTAIPAHALDPLGRPPPSLLFVGNFTHPPNVDAALRLGQTIFPAVQATYPDLVLQIVGEGPPPALQEMRSAQMVVTGRVPDVTPYLDQAAIVVAPLRLGGGMRVKVLEALAAGKALIASPLAVEGLDVADGEQILRAETDAEFCAAIAQLLVDPPRRAALGTQARAWAQANLGWTRSIAAYEQLYADLLQCAPAGTPGKWTTETRRHRDS